LRGTPHHFLVAGPIDVLPGVWSVDSRRWFGPVDVLPGVWSVDSRRWFGPVFSAFSRQVTAADDIIPVRAALRFAIDFSIVVGEQLAAACLEIGIPNIGLYAHIGRAYPALLVVAALVLSGIFLLLAATCE
jgi:hypothetical protein